MDYVKLGNSGLEVSRLGIGCMSFGSAATGQHTWTLDDQESERLILRSIEAGINFFDTANAYSLGTSESIVGQVLAKHAKRDQIVLATKVHAPMHDGPNSVGLSRKSIMAELDNSLRRLKTDYIDLYQIHRWDPRTPIAETLGALDDAVRAGKIRYIGASSMYAWQFSKALYTSKIEGLTSFISMQNQYNLLNREEEREMLPLCADQGVGVTPWSPLARGRLARPWGTTTLRSENDGFGQVLYGNVSAEPNIVKNVQDIAVNRGVSMAQISLAWVLRQPTIASPIVGLTRDGHLDDALASLKIELTSDECTALESAYQPRAITGFN